MISRAWIASAGWAFLCCLAGQVFITVATIGLFLLFFGAVVTTVFPPLLLLLSVGEGTGWQVVLFIALGFSAITIVSGLLMRWAFRRCRAVVFPLVPETQVQWSWARRSSVLVGIVASFAFVAIVPGFYVGALPGTTPEPADAPSTSGTV